MEIILIGIILGIALGVGLEVKSEIIRLISFLAYVAMFVMIKESMKEWEVCLAIVISFVICWGGLKLSDHYDNSGNNI